MIQNNESEVKNGASLLPNMRDPSRLTLQASDIRTFTHFDGTKVLSFKWPSNLQVHFRSVVKLHAQPPARRRAAGNFSSIMPVIPLQMHRLNVIHPDIEEKHDYLNL
jgi:hypothetical protein